jgi:hypothetical protein
MSTFLKIELGNFEREKGFINNIRGYGTFIGFDAHNTENTILL